MDSSILSYWYWSSPYWNNWLTSIDLTLFFRTFPFDSSENTRKPLVFWSFQRDQKGILGRKGLTYLKIYFLVCSMFIISLSRHENKVYQVRSYIWSFLNFFILLLQLYNTYLHIYSLNILWLTFTEICSILQRAWLQVIMMPWIITAIYK